jgi:hypothetical protein
MMRLGLCLAAALCIPASFAAVAQDTGGLFDKPMNVVRIPLPKHDPEDEHVRPMLSCFYYDSGMVKQIDPGIGAIWLSILPRDAGKPLPNCVTPRAPDEKALLGWLGYFKGIRGPYVFFDAHHRWNGGTGFAVFSFAEGQKLFDDVADTIHGVDVRASGLTLRYRRAYAAPCSLYADSAGCWSKVALATALTGDAPDCAAAYEADIALTGADRDKVTATPTIVAYEAETLLGSTGAVTKPLPGAVTCQPATR